VLDNRTRKMALADPVCQRLMTVPGVGFITALTFKAGVDDPKRFKRSRTVGAHFGLTPRRFQSGEMDIDGHISKCGDADVRSTLYTAANALLTRSARWSPLKAWGMKLAKTRGHRRAVIAVARKLAVILHRVWIDDTQFPQKMRPGVDVVWMKPCTSAVLESTSKSLALHTVQPMPAADRSTYTDCEEKRDPRQDATNRMPYLLLA